MNQIKFSVAAEATSKSTKSAVIVIGATKVGNAVEQLGGNMFSPVQLANLGVSGKAEAITRTLGADGNSYAVLGLGSDKPSINEWRELGGAIGRLLAETEELQLELPVEDIEQAQALLLGIALGSYSYSLRPTKVKLAKVTLITPLSISKEAIKEQLVLAEAVQLIRDLATTPANELYPEEMAKRATKLAEKNNLEIKVWDEKQLKKDGFGLISAVGMGSHRPPRLIKITHNPKGATKHLALVGKGITFDTGGLAIKPRTGMLGMKYDMTGSATVMAAVKAIAQLGLPIKVTGYLCMAENMPSGNAMRPGDVFTAHNGKTVEVTNPDAEGRLVLADGLSAASQEQPDLIVDVATLTGAVRTALGNRYTGLMGSSDGVAAIEAAANQSGELVWELPLAKDLRSYIDSPVADYQNSNLSSAAGGTIVGGWFIHEFIGEKADGSKLDWAHLDIAAAGNNEGAPYGFVQKGFTGVMLRTLVSLAQQMAG